VYLKTVVKPAYTAYIEMGPKALNPANRNMLSQVAATYIYRTDPTGKVLGLVSGEAQTWSKTWTGYRFWDANASAFSNVSSPPEIWRKGPTYGWGGTYSRIQPEGTQQFSTSDEFSFSGGANTNWIYQGETALYDRYGMPLQSNNESALNPVYSATKMGYGDKVIVASATNAKHSEIAFSSAEDQDTSAPGYFGGEIAVNIGGTPTVVHKSAGQDAHTGDCALSLTSGNGFVYMPLSLTSNRSYRASVWSNSATNARIYFKINGAETVSSPTAVSVPGKAGWYLLNLDIPVGATAMPFEVGVRSASGTIYFDDFRFQPADAIMTCYVNPPLSYDFKASPAPQESAFTYILDNDNRYTKYETSPDGLIKRVYRESTTSSSPGEKQVSETKSDYRRFHINQ